MAQVNYVITNGSISEQLKYSLFKLLDWRVGNAVCITHSTAENYDYISINDCPADLRQRLVENLGGVKIVGLTGWDCEGSEVNISDVIKVVSEWVKEQV